VKDLFCEVIPNDKKNYKLKKFILFLLIIYFLIFFILICRNGYFLYVTKINIDNHKFFYNESKVDNLISIIERLKNIDTSNVQVMEFNFSTILKIIIHDPFLTRRIALYKKEQYVTLFKKYFIDEYDKNTSKILDKLYCKADKFYPPCSPFLTLLSIRIKIINNLNLTTLKLKNDIKWPNIKTIINNNITILYIYYIKICLNELNREDIIQDERVNLCKIIEDNNFFKCPVFK